ncbi:MAG: sugar-binding transcriptional regulator [Acidobacteria bacterium]|nr:sugar-binding transcriptional regulator [Acidobacteriota bacterium]
MARIDELRLMTKVARMYHEQGLRQTDIMEKLDLSQSTISRLLKRAEAEQIVRITVNTPMGVFCDLEEGLQARLGLKQAIVVDSVDDDEAIARDVGKAAAYYIESTLKQNEVVGISSWSATLLHTVNAMHTFSRETGATVVQILGGIGSPAASVHANHLTARLSQVLRAEPKFLPAPGVVSSVAGKKAFLEDPFVLEVVELFDKVTFALVGIGAVEPSKLLAASGNVFSEEELNMLRERGAVGDLCLRFFDIKGAPVRTPLDERVISMTHQQLQHVRRSIGVAGGRRKHAAIRGALEGRWINVLITDRTTAEQLLAAPAESDRRPPKRRREATPPIGRPA